MKTRNLLSACLLLISATLAAQIVKVETRQLPALYKAKNGPKQKIEVAVDYEGKPVTSTLTWDGKNRTEKLENGRNLFQLEVDPVTSAKQLEVTLTCNKKPLTTPVTVNPVRNWRMNFVQHTHTDIGYTRSQMEILAEQLRYIDYALDYCDATDNYPDFAKFRWVCETAWAVSEYLKSRPAEQIARLKKEWKKAG
jgi:hypothetical protein